MSPFMHHPISLINLDRRRCHLNRVLQTSIPFLQHTHSTAISQTAHAFFSALRNLLIQ